MKIAVFTSGRLPIPAVQGGAVEMLVDELFEYNNSHHLHDITVFSVKPNLPLPNNPNTSVNHYVFVDTISFLAKLKRRLYTIFHHREFYYDEFIEYYLHLALQRFRKQQYDVVIIESRPFYAPKIRAYSNAPILVHLHNDWMSDVSSKELITARQSIDKVITVSDYMKTRVQMIPDGMKVETVHNGIKLDHFYQAQPKERTIFGFDKEDIVLVYSGRINRDKGVTELIDAFLRLQSNPHLKLLIIGSSFFGNDVMVDPFIVELKQKSAILKERIVFTGFVPYLEMPSYLKIADIAVIPSMWEDPFPTTVLEALACGLPIVASRSGGIPESAGEGNILVDRDAKFIGSLSDALQTFIIDKSLRESVGKKNLLRSKQYDKSIYAKNFFLSLSEFEG